jgi:hypothetical protein
MPLTRMADGNLGVRADSARQGAVIVNQPLTINAPGATADTVALIKSTFAPLLAQNKAMIVGAVQQAMRARGGRLPA